MADERDVKASELDFRELAKLALIGAGLFFVGALIAFGYSWRPLHGELRWKVADLEERLDSRNRENLALGAELAKLRSTFSDRVEPEALKQIEKELDKTRGALSKSEKALERSERKRREHAEASTRWRKRFEELRDSAPAAPTPATDRATGGERTGAGGPLEAPGGPESGNGAPAFDGPSADDSPSRTGPGMLSPAGSDPTAPPF